MGCPMYLDQPEVIGWRVPHCVEEDSNNAEFTAMVFAMLPVSRFGADRFSPWPPASRMRNKISIQKITHRQK